VGLCCRHLSAEKLIGLGDRCKEGVLLSALAAAIVPGEAGEAESSDLPETFLGGED